MYEFVQTPYMVHLSHVHFTIYKFYLKKKSNCNDIHAEVFRSEIYQMPLTLKLKKKKWVNGQIEEWIDL